MIFKFFNKTKQRNYFHGCATPPIITESIEDAILQAERRIESAYIELFKIGYSYILPELKDSIEIELCKLCIRPPRHEWVHTFYLNKYNII